MPSKGPARQLVIAGVALALSGGAIFAVWPSGRPAVPDTASVQAHFAALDAAERAQIAVSIAAATPEKFAALNANSPLWEWWDFTLPGHPLRDQALAVMRTLPLRQLQSETMLEDNYALPMAELPDLALEATPALCGAARRFLRSHADSLRAPIADVAPFALVARRFETYLPAMRWLHDRGCDTVTQIAIYEVAALRYQDSDQRRRFLRELAALRDAR